MIVSRNSKIPAALYIRSPHMQGTKTAQNLKWEKLYLLSSRTYLVAVTVLALSVTMHHGIRDAVTRMGMCVNAMQKRDPCS